MLSRRFGFSRRGIVRRRKTVSEFYKVKKECDEMTIHRLKILKEYAIPKLTGDKTFEIRKNDREFAIGDIVIYECIDDSEINKLISDKRFKIVYICDFLKKDGYVVYSEKEIF